MGQITVKLDIEDVNKLKALFVGFPTSKAVKALIRERDERITKTDIFSYIDKQFQVYVKKLEGRLKDNIGDF